LQGIYGQTVNAMNNAYTFIEG